MQQVSSLEELQTAKESRGTYVVFKHSTTCPISARAHQEVTKFEQESPVPVYMIRVIEERPVSLAFAEETGVRHASPQAFVMVGDEVKWHTSHYDITTKALQKAVETASV